MGMRSSMDSLDLLVATRRERELMEKQKEAEREPEASRPSSAEEAAAEPSPRATA